MDRDDVLIGLFATATALCAGETIFRLKDRNASKARFLRERWTLEKSWERFDAMSGWELVPGFSSEDIRINRHGFRGPELVKVKTCRVLCLGDSVTFGPMGEKNPYPYIAREQLSKTTTPRPVEVINAGVGGHSSANMRFRINRLMRFKPDVVVIFAGWNDMFSDDFASYADLRGPVSSFWHLDMRKNVRSYLVDAMMTAAARNKNRPIPVAYSSSEFVPFNFEYNLREIVSVVAARNARAAIMTLPSLIPNEQEAPTPAMIKKVMFPQSIGAGDYGTFRTIYRAYDAVIRRVAADTGSALIDTASLFDDQKRPRVSFFEDTCHLSPLGHKLAGTLVAERLMAEGLIE
jgi:lysophospholipase L1-like esterase